MNPNSRNQRWSKWTLTITPGGFRRPPYDLIKAHASRYASKVFGLASQMHIEQFADGRVRLMVRTEGHPVHDPEYTNHIRQLWTTWAIAGFGLNTILKCDAKLEAGSRQDGTPPDQLIIGASFTFRELLGDKHRG